MSNCTAWRGARRDRAGHARLFVPRGVRRQEPLSGQWLPWSLRQWLNGSDDYAGAPTSAVTELLQRPLWQMCYGGSFAARRSEMVKWPHALWQWLTDSLTRGDNIAEGHFAERLWGALLAPSLSVERREAMLCATQHVRTIGGYFGALVGCDCRTTCSKYASMTPRGPGRAEMLATRGASIVWSGMD